MAYAAPMGDTDVAGEWGGEQVQFGEQGARLTYGSYLRLEQLLSAPLADAYGVELSDRARRDALAVVTSSYEEHGGFRLRTLSA